MDARNFCCSIGMKLLALDSFGITGCVHKMLARYPFACLLQINIAKDLNIRKINYPGYPKAFDVDYWTSGTTQDCKETPVWCSSGKVVDPIENNWKSGHPIENSCVHLRISENSANDTIIASAACSEQKIFVCEVLFKQIYYLSVSAPDICIN